MNLLALDTSTEHCSVALWRDGKLTVRDCKAEQRHSELLLPMVRELMLAAELRLDELDAIAYAAGPGSFTGLRIGCGVVQGLAYGANLPTIAIVTLLALAEASSAERVIAVLDARMGEVYHAAYQRVDDDWEEVCAPGLYAPESVPLVTGDGWHGVGSGFHAGGAQLRTRYGEQLASVDASAVPHAASIAALAARAYARGAARPAHEASPVYLRDKVALTLVEQRASV